MVTSKEKKLNKEQDTADKKLMLIAQLIQGAQVALTVTCQGIFHSYMRETLEMTSAAILTHYVKIFSPMILLILLAKIIKHFFKKNHSWKILKINSLFSKKILKINIVLSSLVLAFILFYWINHLSGLFSLTLLQLATYYCLLTPLIGLPYTKYSFFHFWISSYFIFYIMVCIFFSIMLAILPCYIVNYVLWVIYMLSAMARWYMSDYIEASKIKKSL